MYNYKIDKYLVPGLTLGTVGLGMEYGIANKNGQPGKSTGLEILSYAYKNGITAFDTARTYGNAEELVGDFLKNTGQQEYPLIITKFKINQQDIHSYEAARVAAFKSVKESLHKLGINKIPICLLHMSRELDLFKVSSFIPKIFKELKNEQLIDVAGISIDHPGEIAQFIDQEILQAFQVPVNVFDQRLIKTGLLKKLAMQQKIVFARSVFLQGLFFIKPGELQQNLSAAAPFLDLLRLMAAKERMTVQQFAFSYIRHMDEIASVVFGAEQIEQVAQNIELLDVPPVSEETIEWLEHEFANTPEFIITPGMWS